MHIKKILNNNAVVVLNDQGKEQIAMGKGIAFKRAVADEIDPAQVDLFA